MRRFQTFLIILSLFICSTLIAMPMPTEWVPLKDAATEKASDFIVIQHNPLQTDLRVEVPGLLLTTFEEAGETYQHISLPLAGSTNEVGKADLPLISTLLAIPPTSDVRVELVSSQTTVIPNITAFPVQEPVIEGQFRTSFVKDADFYAKDTVYPKNIVSVGEPVIMRDFRVAPLTVNPVQYNPATKEVTVHHDLEIRVVYEGTNMTNAKTAGINKMSEHWIPIYEATITNFADVSRDYDVISGSFLIIMPNNTQIQGYMNDFVEWKHRKGYNTKLVNLTETGSSSVQIRNYIVNAYNNWEFPPEFVMLVGDEDNNSVGQMPDSPYGSYASDHDYATVDGNDFLADIFVGRMSVDNVSEVSTYVNKVIAYESDPYMDDGGAWLDKALMVAESTHAITPVWTCEWVREQLEDHGFTQVDTLYEHYNLSISASQITNSINAGKGIVNYRGWAFASGWSVPSYTVSNLSGLSNGWQTGIMTSIVCGTGNFGSGTDPCYGEAWIRFGTPTTPKCGVAFAGTTDGSTHTKWNNPITTGFYHGMLVENIREFAACFVRGKLLQYLSFPNNDQPGGTIELYHHTYNVLSDPTVQTWTDTPKSFNVTHAAAIPYGQNSFSVSVTENGSPVEGATVVLWKTHGSEDDVYIKATTEANGQVTMMIDPLSAGTMKITVLKHNYLPYLGNVSIQQNDAVGVDSWSVGGTENITPGDEVTMTITLKNFGTTTMTNVNASITSLTEWADMTPANVSFGDISANGTAMGTITFSVPANAMDMDKIRLNLGITADGGHQWPGVIHDEVKAYHLIVSGITGTVNPGSTGNISVNMHNVGSLSGHNLVVTMQSSSTLVTVTDGSDNLGNMPPNTTQVGTYSINVQADVFNGMQFNMRFVATDNSGYTHEFFYPVPVGQMTASAIIGPDSYGYYAYDDADPEMVAPVFDWIEITDGEGVVVPGMGDDTSTIMELPFDFQYYGQNYSEITICENGWFSFGETHWANFRNWNIPNPLGPDAMVMVFWDDLSGVGPTRNVYTWYDQAQHQYVIEWNNLLSQWGGSGSNTFQAILRDPEYYLTPTGDGEIIFQYQNVNNGDYDNNYATVGIENPTQTDGIQYHYANIAAPGGMNISQGRAIRFTTTAPINAISKIGGTVYLEGTTQGAEVTTLHLWQMLHNDLIHKDAVAIDASGDFLFENVYSITGFGEYYLSVTLDDLYAPTLEWYDDQPDFDSATMIELNNGDDLLDLAIEVSIPTLPDISGQVTDQSAQPLETALITLWRHSDSGNPIFLQSIPVDELGMYTFNNGYADHLAPGTYYLSTKLATDTEEAQWYDGADDYATATPLEIDYDYPLSGIDFTLAIGNAAGISGIVTDEAGNPLENMKVVAWQDHNGTAEAVEFAFTGNAGIYMIGGSGWNALDAGDYYVSLTMPDQGLYPIAWYDSADSYENATPVTVADGAVTADIDLQAPVIEFGTITGTVTWDGTREAAEGARVNVVVDDFTAYWASTETDENGHFSVLCPSASDAIVYVAHPQYGGIAEFNGDAATPDEAIPVTVTAGGATTVDFGLPEIEGSSRVTGSITGVGSPLSIAFVQVFNASERDVPIMEFPSTGPFNKLLSVGDYVFAATGFNAAGQKAMQYFDMTVNPGDATVLTLVNNQFYPDTNFELDFSGQDAFSGSVTRMGEPVVNAHVIAVSYDENTEELVWANATYTEEDGSYNLYVPGGQQYRIMVLGRHGVPIFYGDTIDWNISPALDPSIDLPIDFAIHEVSEAQGCTISGRITFTNHGVSGARIYAFDEHGRPAAYAFSDNAGYYTLTGLQPDLEYTLQVNKIGFYHGVGVTTYRLGAFTELTNVNMEIIRLGFIDIEEDENNIAAASTHLFQNYPNPFNPTTAISFQLSAGSRIDLTVYNSTGQLVKTLATGQRGPGTHEVIWDGRNDTGLPVGSGIYFYRLKTDNGDDEVKSMILLK